MPIPPIPEENILPATEAPAAMSLPPENATLSPEHPARDPNRKGPWRARVLLALGMVGVIALGTATVARRQPEKRLAPAKTVINARLTLVTSDRADVACASLQTPDQWRCGYDGEGNAWSPGRNEQTTVQPFMTVDRRLFLVPGLFLEPAIRARYDAEPPQVGRAQLKRFTADCKLTVVSGMTSFRLRWTAQDPWSPPEQPTEIAEVSDCKIDG